MKETNGQRHPNRRRKPVRAPAEIGAVRIFFNPGPDAQDRLRRLASLLIKYATQERDASEQQSLVDDRPDYDSTEADA